MASDMRTIGVLYPGAMGASMAWRLHISLPHLNLLTSLGSRSAATKTRAQSAGLSDVSMESLVERSDIIISILPPSEAITLAKEVTSLLPRKEGKKSVYIDANAISPETCTKVGSILKEKDCTFIDGSVIGGPAKAGYDPMVYLSTAPENEKVLRQVAQAMGGGGEKGEGGKQGLLISVMSGAGEGAASALKMAYGGINKGTTGLACMMVIGERRVANLRPRSNALNMTRLSPDREHIILKLTRRSAYVAAHAHSPETSEALAKELARSRPDALKSFSSGIPGIVPKAYRVSLHCPGLLLHGSSLTLALTSKDCGAGADAVTASLSVKWKKTPRSSAPP